MKEILKENNYKTKKKNKEDLNIFGLYPKKTSKKLHLYI